MSSLSPSDIFHLESSDHQIYPITRQALQFSNILMILQDMEPTAIGNYPLPNITGKVLQKVVNWCEHFKDNPPAISRDRNDFSLLEWDPELMQENMAFEMIMAANYLDMPVLLDACAKRIAASIGDGLLIRGMRRQEQQEQVILEEDENS